MGLRHAGAPSGLLTVAVAMVQQHVLFAPALLHVVVVRFSIDQGIVQKLVHLDSDRAGKAEELLARVRRAVEGIIGDRAGKAEEMLARVRRAVEGIIYADDAGIIVSKSDELLK